MRIYTLSVCLILLLPYSLIVQSAFVFCCDENRLVHIHMSASTREDECLLNNKPSTVSTVYYAQVSFCCRRAQSESCYKNTTGRLLLRHRRNVNKALSCCSKRDAAMRDDVGSIGDEMYAIRLPSLVFGNIQCHLLPQCNCSCM